MIRHIGPIIASVAALLAFPCVGYDRVDPRPKDDTESLQPADATARAFLNELSARRRVTTLFENRQSAFHGVQENFVNTSTGNLTFLVRDLVRVGGMPIMMGRVYDSALSDDDATRDFGPGWRLAVRETVSREGAGLLYTDASNSQYALDLRDGAIVPRVAALTPVTSGTLDHVGPASVVELRHGDMVRHFVRRHAAGTLPGSREDRPWRLTHVRHAQGWLRIERIGGVAMRLVSDQGSVELIRRADGRVTAARDDLGRSVAYAYDANGRLSIVTDLAGKTWRYSYGERGALVTILDPAGKEILTATHENGRAAKVRVLQVETTFHFASNITRTVDGLGRTATFHSEPSGITTAVSDATTGLTQVEFDADYHPVSIIRDGAAVARMRYDISGRLDSLWRPEGALTFGYEDDGLASVDGVETGRYGYESGRVVYAADNRDTRSYGYGPDGGLSKVVVNGVETELGGRADGSISAVWRDGDRLLAIEHERSGRVLSMARSHGDESNTVRYAYDARGFRTAARYGREVSSSIEYDAVGNLVRYEIAHSAKTVLSQEYVIGDYNQVDRIRTGDGPDLAFSYDAMGRLTTASAGPRTASVVYDGLDRPVRVKVDHDVLISYDYARTDAGAAVAVDRITSATPVPLGTSFVFGTMATMVYTRPSPMHFGPVVYEPALRTFVATHRHLVPDALLASSMDRRLLPWRGGAVDWRPFGIDKPSNSLFIPPEYRSVNCFVCTGWLGVVSIEVPTSVVAGESFKLVLTAGGVCEADHTSPGDGFGGAAASGPAWHHAVTLGDGTTINGTGATLTVHHTYDSPGNRKIRDIVACSPCQSPFANGEKTKSISVKERDAHEPSAEEKALIAEIDQCIRDHSEDVRNDVDPHDFDYGDVNGGFGQAGLRGRHIHHLLDLPAIRSEAPLRQTTTKDILHAVIVHEYVHHLEGISHHGRVFQRRESSLLRETRACD